MIFMIHTIIYIDGVLYWLKYIFFFKFSCVVNVSLMLGQRCRRRTSNKPAITARAVSVVTCQRHWTTVGTTLAASERDIETSNAIRVWLRSANVSPVLTALSQHWANISIVEQVTTTRCHSPTCHRVGEWVTIHKPCHAFTWTLIDNRLIIFTNKQKLTKR